MTFRFDYLFLTFRLCFQKASKNKLNWMKMFVDLFLDVFDHNFVGSTEMKKVYKVC